eukprot:Clim_evm33s128 gene=Clim_evmTU33s128
MPPKKKATPAKRAVQVTPTDVMLFIPNVIGYFRLILLMLSVSYAFSDATKTFWFYFWGALLDMTDGYAARKFGQSSKLGAVLDMVTDRVAFCLMTCVVASLVKDWEETGWWWSTLCYVIAGIDLCSHWFHTSASLYASEQSHKATGDDKNWMLNAYYSNRALLAFLCFGNEAFFAGLYIMAWLPNGQDYVVEFQGQPVHLVFTGTALFAPIMAAKTAISIVQMWEAIKVISRIDAVEHSAKLK